MIGLADKRVGIVGTGATSRHPASLRSRRRVVRVPTDASSIDIATTTTSTRSGSVS